MIAFYFSFLFYQHSNVIVYTQIPEVFEGTGTFPSSTKNRIMNDAELSRKKHRIEKNKSLGRGLVCLCK